MKRIVLAAAFSLIASVAYAQSPTCKAQSAEKKLSGAAKNSFTKKCVSDAVGT